MFRDSVDVLLMAVYQKVVYQKGKISFKLGILLVTAEQEVG